MQEVIRDVKSFRSPCTGEYSWSTLIMQTPWEEFEASYSASFGLIALNTPIHFELRVSRNNETLLKLTLIGLAVQ